MKRSVLIVFSAVQLFGVDLVRNGKTRYSICLSPEASLSEAHAAGELQTFLEQISGARLSLQPNCVQASPHAIVIGDGPAVRALKIDVPTGSEEYRLQTAGERLVIAGGRLRGTMYGVYAFLDRLGCRWFTKEVSRIPHQPTVRLPQLSETGKPAFEYREPFFTEAWDRDWAARNRTNGDHTKLDASVGGKVQYYPFVHSFNELIPPEKYFKDRPDYFSLIGGKRRSERSQLCLTNPDVLALVIQRVEDWIAAHPDATIFSVSQNDWEGWCECDRCRRAEAEEGGTHSGPLLRFVNAVASAVGPRHPDKLIDTLAYWYTEAPPLHVKPAPNVRIRLCPIGICIAHPMEQCPRSAYFVNNLRAWAAITNQLYIWHYNTNFSHYLAPMPDFDELRADLAVYRRNGVVGLFLQGAYPPGGGGESSELRAYVLARLLWDPSIDADVEINDFLKGVYGPAAPAMRRYFDLLHREVRPPPQGLGQHLWIFNLPKFSPAFRQQAESLFREAQSATNDPAVKLRLEKAHLPLEYMDVAGAREYKVDGTSYSPPTLTELKDSWIALLAKLPGFGITSIHEGRDLAWDRAAVDGMRPLPVITLQDDVWRADVVPALAGRTIRLIDRRNNRDLLRRPDPGDRSYPSIGGVLVEAGPDAVTRPWNASWKLVSSTATALVEQADFENHLRLVERLTLTGGKLHIEIEAQNRGESPLQAAVQLAAHFDPGDIDSVSVSFRSQDQFRNLQPVQAAMPPDGSAIYEGDLIPDGTWEVRTPGGGVVMSFDRSRTSRAVASWSAKGVPRITLATWSKPLMLQPKESSSLKASISGR